MRTAVLTLLLCLAPFAHAQNVTVVEPAFEDTVFRAKVLEIRSAGERAIPATRTVTEYQDVVARIMSGERAGEVIVAENTTSVELGEGDIFYVHLGGVPGNELWAVGEPDRMPVLSLLALLFIGVTVAVAGMAGAKAIAALAASFGILLFGLVPALLAGWPPVLTCVGFAVLMLVVSMVVTHGWNREMLVALAGGATALALSALIAETAVELAKLSGFVDEEVVYLNFALRGELDLTGLLLGGILVGITGVLNDISVSQVHTVAEIHRANPTLSRRDVLARAMRVGKEHYGAVVNTLPLAYAGSALPLLMLFSVSTAPVLYIVNREVFAAEIIRILSGGVALALSGAVATALAVLILVRPR